MTSHPQNMEEDLKGSLCNDRGQQYVEAATEGQLWNARLGRINKELNEVDQKFSELPPSKKIAERKILRRIETIETMTNDNKPIVYPQALRRSMTPELVQEALSRYKAYSGESQTNREMLASQICLSYCKIYAILLKFGSGKLISKFMAQGIDDSNLPLQGTRRNDRYGVLLKGGVFGYIEEWEETSEWRNFFTWQWHFLTPFLARPGGKVLHYKLESDDILPILPEDDEEMESSITSVKPLQIVPIVEAYGGNATVNRIKLDPLSCDFGDFNFQHRDGLYAMKHLTGFDQKATKKDFLCEVFVWKTFNKKSQEKVRLHISPLLCTFEKGNNYYLLFPWATGDLWRLFETQDSSDPQFSESWIAEQCWKIAEALSVIHQDQEDRNPSNPDDYDEKQLYGRHGDIKPHNILWFGDYIGCKGAGCLVVADFGIAKCHKSRTKSMSMSANARYSPTYKAPEFEATLGRIGRKADIWGLGCTFLELITWYLRGWHAVSESFPDIREEIRDEQKGIVSQDTYFSIVNGSPVVKQGVLDWIAQLREEKGCTPFFSKFLNLIERKMLLVTPSDRATADDVSNKMREFHHMILGPGHTE